jgi:hypothetical protein
VARDDKEKLIQDELELISFLESSLSISAEDVYPLFEVVMLATEASLESVIQLLVNYQPSVLQKYDMKFPQNHSKDFA